MFAPRKVARSAEGATGNNAFHDRTFGEMGAHEKAAMSHRARAFAAFAHAVLK
jgi:inosine/xanthosine triphosphate pyrophosphatase family protein